MQFLRKDVISVLGFIHLDYVDLLPVFIMEFALFSAVLSHIPVPK
jgi:hypothetical protein